MRKTKKMPPRNLSECYSSNPFVMERNLQDYIAFELRYLHDYSICLTAHSIAERYKAIGTAYSQIGYLISHRCE